MYDLLSILIDTGAGFLSMLPFLILLEILARREIPYIPLKHLIGDGIFCFFLSSILALAKVPSFYEMRLPSGWNIVPFRGILEEPAQAVSKILLFLPLGFLLPLLFRKYQKPSRCLVYGILFSGAMELWQLFSFHSMNIDDLLLNALGMAAGYGLFALWCIIWPPTAEVMSLSDQTLASLPALLELETGILTAAACAGAFFMTSAVRGWIWKIFL